MEVCEEMQKLRDWLDKNNIKWKDVSEDFHRFKFNETNYEMWICRTHFNIKGHKVSVINGYGTYGGYGIISEENQGLLETMGLWGGEESVKGYLTADEVINKAKGFISYLEEKEGSMDFIITEAMEICGENPGALTFFLEALKGAEGDAKSNTASKVVSAFSRMKENSITDSKLYMLWNDCCDRDTDRAIYIMLHDTIESINKHINFGNGRGIPYTESEPEPYKRESEGEWWIFTFMSDGSDNKSGKCVKIKGTYGEAREKMCDKYGNHWAFQRSEKEWEESWNNIDREYWLEEIIDIID